jgi:hypothetical protein
MDIELTSLGWRDGILLLVAVAALYLVFVLIKLTQIGQRRPAVGHVANPTPAAPLDMVSPLRRRAEADALLAETEFPVAAGTYPTAAYLDSVSPDPPPAESFAVSSQPTFEWDEVRSLFGETMEPGAPASASTLTPPPRRSTGFGEHLAEHLARSDMEMEVQRMRSEMEHMRSEVEELRAARRVSPQYAEAMELAQRGLTAQDLADQLGISLGEAELVHALSRSDRNFDEGEEHGAEPHAAGFNEFDHRRAG